MNPYLIPGLSLAPQAIRLIVEQIPKPGLDTPAYPERFSPREVVAHLADWEPILRERIRQAVERPGSAIQGVDEGARAVEQRYSESDIEERLGVYESERKKTVEYVLSLTPEELDRSATHSERGPQSARDMAEMLVGHDMYHVEQLARSLGHKTAGTW